MQMALLLTVCERTMVLGDLRFAPAYFQRGVCILLSLH